METRKSTITTDAINEPLVEPASPNGVSINEKLIAASTGSADDIEQFCVAPGSAAPVAKQILLRIRVGKPPKQDFVRVRPEPDFQREIYVFKDESAIEDFYLVAPGLVAQLGGLAVRKLAQFAVTRRGAPFIWLIKLPGDDGRLDSWSETALAAAQLARTTWTRITANMATRCYDIFTPSDGVEIPDPTWPDISMTEAMKLAFDSKIIRDQSHAIIQRIYGRA